MKNNNTNTTPAVAHPKSHTWYECIKGYNSLEICIKILEQICQEADTIGTLSGIDYGW